MEDEGPGALLATAPTRRTVSPWDAAAPPSPPPGFPVVDLLVGSWLSVPLDPLL